MQNDDVPTSTFYVKQVTRWGDYESKESVTIALFVLTDEQMRELDRLQRQNENFGIHLFAD